MSFKLNFLSKLTLLSFLSIVISDVYGYIAKAKTETELSNLFPTKEEWENGRRDPKQPFPTSKDEDPLVLIFRESFAASPESCVGGLADLTPVESAYIRKSWAENKDKVLLLNSEMCDILTILDELTDNAWWSSRCLMRAHEWQQEWQQVAQHSIKAAALINNHRDKLQLLKQFRFLEFLSRHRGLRISNENFLAKLIVKYNENEINPDEVVKITSAQPRDIVELITKKAMTKLGSSILHDLEQLIFVPDISYGEKYPPILHELTHGVLKLFDFLHVNCFIDHIQVQSFFQSITKNPKRVKELIRYIEHNALTQHSELLVEFGSPYWTKHWTWHLLPRCIQALSNHEELINAYVILDLHHHRMLDRLNLESARNTKLKRSFFDAFERNDYYAFLQVMGNAHSFEEIQHDLVKKAFQELNVNSAVDLLQIEVVDASDLSLAYHLLYILDFIEGQIFPGDTNTIDRKELKLDNLKEKMDLLRLGAKLEDLMSQGQDLLMHRIEKKIKASLESSGFNEILNKARDTCGQIFLDTSERRWRQKFPGLMNILEKRYRKNVGQKAFFAKWLPAPSTP